MPCQRDCALNGMRRMATPADAGLGDSYRVQRRKYATRVLGFFERHL